MSESSESRNDPKTDSGKAPKGDPMKAPATFTTPPRADEAAEPPPAIPQGDGSPSTAPRTPTNGSGEGAGTATTGPIGATPSAGGKPPSRMRTVWQGEHRFDSGRPDGGPTVRYDASARTGPSPVDALVSALAACVSVDVVDILA